MTAHSASARLIVRVLASACLVAGTAWAAPSPAPSAPVQGPPPDPGVWKKHEYDFHFMGFTSTYSCDGLADQLKTLLIAAGARKDVKSMAECSREWGRPDKFAAAKLTFYALVPATDAKAGDGEPGAGVWKTVLLAPNTPRNLQAGDCELVEQFRDQVLPMFTIRNRQDATSCIPHQLSGSNFNLKFETFAPASGPLPAGAMSAANPTPLAASPPVFFAYPAKGQSPDQQAQDRAACSSAAMASSGYDPARPETGTGPDGATHRAQYETQVKGCLVDRGYSVR